MSSVRSVSVLGVEVVEVYYGHLGSFVGQEYPGQPGTFDTQTLHEVWNDHWEVSGGCDVILSRSVSLIARMEYIDSNTQIPNSNQVPVTQGDYYISFTGVPYASNPANNRRFQEAEPMRRWHGDYDATRRKGPCPRAGTTSMMGLEENCLYLNVFTKNINTRNNQVGVWPAL